MVKLVDEILLQLQQEAIKHDEAEYLSTAEIRAAEINSTLLGISLEKLMENAGKSIAEFLLSTYSSKNEFLFLIGSGNNGGDGLVAARRLLDQGCKVKLVLVSRSGRVKGKEAIQALQKLTSKHNVSISTIRSEKELNELKLVELFKTHIVVDAIFGTGLKSEVTGVVRLVLDEFQKAKTIVSVDLPSGMNADTGEWYCEPFLPTHVVTFHKKKLCFKKLKKVKIHVYDIGIPVTAEVTVLEGHLRAFWPHRDPFSHKGKNGRVMIVGGSIEYTGAPVLAAMSCLRAGADTVRISIPSAIHQIVASYSPDFICMRLEGEYFNPRHVPAIAQKAIERHESIVIGMGISNKPEAWEAARELVNELKENNKVNRKVQIVLDADGIRAFRDHLDVLKNSDAIITPHKRELAWLLGIDRIPRDLVERVKFVKDTAKKLGVTILLKGKYDIITNGKRVLINPSGHEGMTVGGTGDTLAGIVGFTASLINNPLYAAALASFVIGRAGEKVAKEYGVSLLATDLPVAVARYLTEQGVNN